MQKSTLATGPRSVGDGGDLTDAQWERLKPLLPVSNGRCGRWRDTRQVIYGGRHGIRRGAQWPDLPERYGSWKAVSGIEARAESHQYGRLKTRLRGRTEEQPGTFVWPLRSLTCKPRVPGFSHCRRVFQLSETQKAVKPLRPPLEKWAATWSACGSHDQRGPQPGEVLRGNSSARRPLARYSNLSVFADDEAVLLEQLWSRPRSTSAPNPPVIVGRLGRSGRPSVPTAITR